MYIEERHRALGRDATFSWSRALTHPPRCNRTRHRGRHLDFVGAAILVSWGPPSWTGSDVKNAKPAPILLDEQTSKQTERWTNGRLRTDTRADRQTDKCKTEKIGSNKLYSRFYTRPESNKTVFDHRRCLIITL